TGQGVVRDKTELVTQGFSDLRELGDFRNNGTVNFNQELLRHDNTLIAGGVEQRSHFRDAILVYVYTCGFEIEECDQHYAFPFLLRLTNAGFGVAVKPPLHRGLIFHRKLLMRDEISSPFCKVNSSASCMGKSVCTGGGSGTTGFAMGCFPLTNAVYSWARRSLSGPLNKAMNISPESMSRVSDLQAPSNSISSKVLNSN